MYRGRYGMKHSTVTRKPHVLVFQVNLQFLIHVFRPHLYSSKRSGMQSVKLYSVRSSTECGVVKLNDHSNQDDLPSFFMSEEEQLLSRGDCGENLNNNK